MFGLSSNSFLLCFFFFFQEKESIVYGSSDGGKTIHYDEPEVNEIMKEIGEYLNLRGHLIHSSTIYGPGGTYSCWLNKKKPGSKFYKKKKYQMRRFTEDLMGVYMQLI